jgi:hypothetical protein
MFKFPLNDLFFMDKFWLENLMLPFDPNSTVLAILEKIVSSLKPKWKLIKEQIFETKPQLYLELLTKFLKIFLTLG